MHINFEDENIIVNNIQLFLKENYDKNIHISGVYDTQTHQALIGYLQQPNTEDFRVVKSRIIEKFTYKDPNPPHSLIDGGGIFNFDNKSTKNEIHFFTKPVHTYFDNGVRFINNHINELKAFVETMGWKVTSFTHYAYNGDNTGLSKAEIIIKKTGITNYFPNKEVLPMINIFDGKYLYGRCFISDDRFTGFIQPHDKFKVGIIPCKPGDTFTITHGYGVACEMAVGYSSHSLREIKNADYLIETIYSRLDNSLQGSVQPGDWIYYEVPKDSNATYLLVQMPYTNDLVATQNQKVTVLLGDVNQDGIIDKKDLQLLNAYVTAKENNNPNSIKLSGNALVAANVTRNVDLDGNPIVDREDVVALEIAIKNGTDLGKVEYEVPVRVSSSEMDRLLVMYGEDAKDESKNVPIDQFYIEPWAVHEKFIQYFLGRVIHKYSYVEDIAWLQANIKNYNANYTDKFIGYYDNEEDYLNGDYVLYDSISGKWKYYRGNLYSGYYLDTHDNIQNCSVKHDDGSDSEIEIINGRIYVGGLFDGRTLLEDGRVAGLNSQYSLKSIVKEFQLRMNKNASHNSVISLEKLTWTIGYYDVDTDERFIKYQNNDVVYDYGAFK